MPTFKYEGTAGNGQKVTGVIEAVSQTAAVNQIRQNCDMVLSIREIPAFANPAHTRRSAVLRKVNAKSLSLACRQFSIILRSGLPLVQAVQLTAAQCADKNLASLLHHAAEDISGGWSLSYSFEQRGSKLLPITFRETVRAGEESGDLVAAFRRMADYFEQMNKTRSSVVSALTYPAFLLAVAVIVIGVIMGYAVPAFARTFDSLGVDLPMVTRVLIGTSGFFRQWGLVLLGLIAVAVIVLRLYAMSERGALIMSRLRLSIPVLGGIVRMSNASQFAHTMSALLTAGMSILQAIEVSGRTMGNKCMSAEVLGTLAGVESGHSFGECLSYTHELPEMLTQMAAVGESSGSLEDTLGVLASYYDNETEVRTKRAVSLLEPALIVFLSAFVVLILFAVYVPLFSMYGAI